MAEVTDVQGIVSSIFNVPADWFNGPIFVLYLVVPLIGLTICYYLLLKKLVFKYSTAPDLVIGAVLAFFSIPMIVASPLIAIAVSVGAPLLIKRITLKRIILSAILIIGIWLAIPYLIGFLL